MQRGLSLVIKAPSLSREYSSSLLNKSKRTPFKNYSLLKLTPNSSKFSGISMLTSLSIPRKNQNFSLNPTNNQANWTSSPKIHKSSVPFFGCQLLSLILCPLLLLSLLPKCILLGHLLHLKLNQSLLT